jgi:hypothetical protein
VRAALVVTASPASALAGDTGDYFDVSLTNTGSDISVLAFSFGLSVTDAYITFTRATTATAAPYIFAGRSFDELTLLLTYIDAVSGGTALSASDMDNDGLGVTVASGATVGLGRVFFDVGSYPAALITVTLSVYPGTNLSDPAVHDIAIDTLVDGAITTPGYTPVPEPATLVPAGLALLAVLTTRRREQRRAW